MEKKYLVTGNWVDKETKKPMSGIAEISSGINKSGQPYEIVNTDSRENPIEGTYPVGTILTATVKLDVQASQSKPQQTQNIKITA